MIQKGKLFVVSAPSGAGKTSLVSALIKQQDRLKLSVSYTTRTPRPGDEAGKAYHFITPDAFSKMISAQGFLEHAAVFGHQYGTGLAWVEDQLALGDDVILEIDWQGAHQVCASYADAVSIFILPPSLDALRERLELRQQDSQAVIEARLSEARSEMSHVHDFQYFVVNDQFDVALKALDAIVLAERLRITPNDLRLRAYMLDLL